MSKRAARREKARKERHLSLRSGYIVALVLVIVGIVGAVLSGQKAREYEKSKDKRKVTAQVIYVEPVTRKDEDGFKKTYWKAKLTYDVEGESFKDAGLFESEVKVNDLREIEVYRTPAGNYRIPRQTEHTLAKILFIAIAVLGVLTAGLSTFVFSEPKRSGKPRRRRRSNDRTRSRRSGEELRERRPRRRRRDPRNSDDQRGTSD